MDPGASGISLKLDKTPNFLDRLQQRLSEGEDEKYRRVGECKEIGKVKSCSFWTREVKIGLWEKSANNENDIVAKFYFNQKKFVWEVLLNQRKYKMDSSLHHISAFRAVFNEQTTKLFIELEKPPAFHMEANPVLQKQTTWVAIRDFTNGEGLKQRQHVLTFRKEVLGKKHYEKIMYSKAMLYLKSCAPFPLDNSPFDNVPNNVGSFLFNDPQLNPHCLSNQTHGNSASQDQQQAVMVHPLNQIPHGNANLQRSSTITNMDPSVQDMQHHALMNMMPANSVSDYQPDYTSAEMISIFHGNIPLPDNRDQILPMVNQIKEQPISARSTPASNLYSPWLNVDPQAQFYDNGSFLSETDPGIQPQEVVYPVNVKDYTSPGVQNSLIENGVYNQSEEVHRPTGYLHDILDPLIGNQSFPKDFSRVNDFGPNHQVLDPSLDMRRTRNEHEGDNCG